VRFFQDNRCRRGLWPVIMPILNVELVGRPSGTSGSLARRIADAAAKVLGSPPGRVWVRLRFLPRSKYAECGGNLPREVRPVFVNLLKARLTPQKTIKKEAAAMAKAIAKACGRSADNVHIFYEPPAAGRAAFGGLLMEK